MVPYHKVVFFLDDDISANYLKKSHNAQIDFTDNNVCDCSMLSNCDQNTTISFTEIKVHVEILKLQK